MGNKTVISEIDNLQKLMLDIAKENEKLKEDNEKIKEDNNKIIKDNEMMKEKMEEMNSTILNQQEDLKDLKESIEELEVNYQEIKDTLGSIQCRDLSKNFLRAFGRYLTETDFKKIWNDKRKRGKIITNRIAALYPNADKKKMELIKNLIKKSSDLILDGNYFAHELEYEQYEEEFQAYKREKKPKKLTSPFAFCFLINLGISDDLFDDSYSFLEKFFDFYLRADESANLLENYFN